MNRIKRAKAQDRVMTVIFYCIAVFFFVLLAAFAGYVIIKGFAGAKLSMFGFTRRGAIGNQLFNKEKCKKIFTKRHRFSEEYMVV